MRTILLLLITGCGYTAGHVARSPATGEGALRPLAVKPFDNESFRRGLEIRLTRLVADEMRGRGHTAPVEPENADWVLTGRILSAGERVLSEDTRDDVRESSFEVVVEVVLEDPAAEKVIGTYSLTESESFSARAGRIATLKQAEEEALRDVAERIVYWLELQDPEQAS